MGYKHINLSAGFYGFIALGLAFLAGYTGARFGFVWLLLLLPVPLFAWLIIHLFNQSNRQIAFFFEAIRNEDSALRFPEGIRQKSLRHLYHSLNELNRRINEIKLRNEYLEKYYQSFIQHAATGLVALNDRHEVELMNVTAFDYAGIPPHTPLHLIPMKNPEVYQAIRSVSSGETVSYRRLSGEAQVNLLIRAREIRFGETSSILLSMQDIRRELDEKEIDAWQKLIRVLTHEIMNSIAPIVSLTGTMRKFLNPAGDQQQTVVIGEEVTENLIRGLDTIEERGKGLLNFVDSYRKLTRIPRPEFDNVDTVCWMGQIRLLMKEVIEQEQIMLSVTVDPRVRSINGDEKLLTQVMINLINNAIEALREREDQRKIEISVALTRLGRPVIRVANNGKPIPADLAEKIFIPFFTTRENGSGIGLSLSRQIMRLHKGSLHVETAGVETAFVITF